MLVEQETLIRLIVFLTGLIGFLLAGIFASYRLCVVKDQTPRWLTNIFLVLLNASIIKLLMPISLTALALLCEKHGTGLLNLAQVPAWLAFIFAVLVMDLGIYWQHRLVHQIPVLWRIHRLHHSDTEIDVTTAGRFHVFEILLSFLIKALIIISLGAPATAVLVFEILLNFCAMFNHANIELPKWLEPRLRKLIVTPEMHRIHHSSKPSETDSNYGFCLSVWDRFFNSYINSAQEDTRTMQIGLKIFRSDNEQSIFALLTQPFK